MSATKFTDPKLMESFLLELTKKDLSRGEYLKSTETTGIELVKEWGGEGEGDNCGYILKITENTNSVLVQVDGSYDSFNGADYDYAEVILVEPREVVVTQYFRIENKGN